MVSRYVKEPLNLARVQIEQQHSIRTGFRNQVGDELRRNRNARPVLAIFARITVVRHHRRDSLRRRAPERVKHYQQLHRVRIDRRAGRLNYEAVFAADVLENLKVELAVRKAPYVSLADFDPQVLADLFSERPVRVSRKDFYVHTLSTKTVMSAEC